MASYIVRVELHSGTPEDYQTLTELMEASGFSGGIRGESGAASRLPTGQYVGTGEVTAAQASQIAQSAALKTKRGYAVFVSDFTTAAWFGLDLLPTAETPA